MDFVILKHEKNIHTLNAVSPGFTSSMAFAEFELLSTYYSSILRFVKVED